MDSLRETGINAGLSQSIRRSDPRRNVNGVLNSFNGTARGESYIF